MRFREIAMGIWFGCIPLFVFILVFFDAIKTENAIIILSFVLVLGWVFYLFRPVSRSSTSFLEWVIFGNIQNQCIDNLSDRRLMEELSYLEMLYNSRKNGFLFGFFEKLDMKFSYRSRLGGVSTKDLDSRREEVLEELKKRDLV